MLELPCVRAAADILLGSQTRLSQCCEAADRAIALVTIAAAPHTIVVVLIVITSITTILVDIKGLLVGAYWSAR